MWTAIAIAGLVLVAAALFSFGSVILMRQRAADTADLAALAAAGQADRGRDAACEQAHSVTRKAALRLLSCRLAGWDALIEVEAAVPRGVGVVTAHARAGPVPRAEPGQPDEGP